MRVLDLFCGAGGITAGWQRAGAYVVGVDINPQPNYCGDEFHQADALTFPLAGFDVVVASPPCQRYSPLNAIHRREYPDLIEPTRQRLIDWAGIYVIENVERARRYLVNPINLCGTMFAGRYFRHRLFESNYPLVAPDHIPHTRLGLKAPGISRPPENDSEVWTIYGHISGVEGARAALGIEHYMTQGELAQAIPPIYSEFIARQIMGLPFWHLLAGNRQMALL